ncbi:hypothetical protein [Ferrimonas gelatinilytica]|uniref:Uncharacterized protein n=1 Tax=Ferrimonas gelatinilytica TaxID=1255257 RepID=A0ABP9S6A9_9GAMM
MFASANRMPQSQVGKPLAAAPALAWPRYHNPPMTPAQIAHETMGALTSLPSAGTEVVWFSKGK